MSYTTLNYVDKDGDVGVYEEYKNSHGFCTFVWEVLYRAKIDPYVRYVPFFEDGEMKKCWDLWKSDKLEEFEKIVLMATFDFVMVKKENFSAVAKSFKKFAEKYHTDKERVCSLVDQAKDIERMIEDIDCKDVVAICWQGTSVSDDMWQSYNEEDEEYEDSVPYNINKDDKHWFLFDELYGKKEK